MKNRNSIDLYMLFDTSGRSPEEIVVEENISAKLNEVINFVNGIYPNLDFNKYQLGLIRSIIKEKMDRCISTGSEGTCRDLTEIYEMLDKYIKFYELINVTK